MPSLSQLFGDAVFIARKHKQLWVLQAILVVTCMVVAYFFVFRHILPLLSQFFAFSARSDLQAEFITSLPDELRQLPFLVLPVVLIMLAVTLIVRPAIYAYVHSIRGGQALSVRGSIRVGIRYVWMSLGMIVVSVLLTGLGYALGYVIALLTDAPIILAGSELILSLLVSTVLFFAWPVILFERVGLAAAFVRSFRLFWSELWFIGKVTALILLLGCVILSLLGLSLSIGYYFGVSAGLITAALFLILTIPVRVMIHTLYIRMYESITRQHG